MRTAHLEKIPTVRGGKAIPNEEWLEYRRHHIGGSDAAAVAGMSKWATPTSVWADKLGKLPQKEDNESMRQGRDLEDYVAQRFTEATGKKVKRENYIFVNKKYPFAHATIDRSVVGENAGLECKTTSSLNLKKFSTGEFPEQYYCQCVHYLAVTEADRWYLEVVVLGQGAFTYCLERKDVKDEIKALMEIEKEFWEYVEKEEMPPVDGENPTTEALSIIYPDSDGTSIDITEYDNDLSVYFQLDSKIKELKKEKDEISNRIKADMAEAERGKSERYNISYKTSERNTFDVKKFASEHPNMDISTYYTTTSVRTFRVTEVKRKDI